MAHEREGIVMQRQAFQRDRETGTLIFYYVDCGPGRPIPGHGRTLLPCASMSDHAQSNVQSSGMKVGRVTGTS